MAVALLAGTSCPPGSREPVAAREDKVMLWQRGLGDGSTGHSGAAPPGQEMCDGLLLLAGVLGMESLGPGSGMMLLLPSCLLPSGAWAA